MDKKIKLIHACMKAGKSKYLIDLCEKTEKENKTFQVFQPAKNTRDGAELKSRAYKDKVIKATPLISEFDLLKSNADVVICDEFQMLNPDNIRDVVKQFKGRKQQLYLAGLDLMASRQEFTTYTKLKDMEEIEKIHIKGKCEICGEPAEYTKLERDPRATDWLENEYNKYTSVCEEHWEDIQIKELL